MATINKTSKLYAGDKFAITSTDGRKFHLVIEQDEFSEDPREWENLGTMLCCNKYYQLGDCNSNEETLAQLAELCRKYGKTDEEIDEMDFREEIQFLLEQDNICGLPLYICDHSGLSMQTYRFDAWDSSFVGLIFIDKETFFAETCYKNDCDWKAEAKKRLKNEIETYSQFLEGDVQQYTLYEETIVTRTNRDGKVLNKKIVYDEMVDSLSGFYNATLEDIEEYLPFEIAEIEKID